MALLKAGATFVTEEQYQNRLTICRTCPHVGQVDVLGKQFEGCTLCGCPLETKMRTKTYLHATKGIIQTTCPASKW